MATQQPLKQMIPALLQHIQANEEYLQFNLRVFNVLEGQVKREVEESLREEILSPAALKRCLQRIPAVNVLQKVTDKLSQVYMEPASRKTDSVRDQELLDEMVKKTETDRVMDQANRLLNAQHCCAVEPYLDGKQQKLRVLPAHTFLPYSDDPVNPLNMTVFIKLLGSKTIKEYTTTKKDGTNQEETKQEIRVVNIYQAFSDKEVIIFHDGGLDQEMMDKFGISSGLHNFGTIPQVYLNTSKYMLLPFVNQMGIDISVLIPKLLTDVNYASQFMSHSIIWYRNSNLEGVEVNPDAWINLGDGDDEGQPEIGTVDPKVDIEAQLQLVEFELSMYFTSLGIKGSTTGSMMPGREASGFAKAMDEADASSVRKKQSEEFRWIERRVWEKLAKMQDVWSRAGAVEEARRFSDEFLPSFKVSFAEMKILKTDKEKMDEIKLMREMSLMTKKQALRKLMPDLTDNQLDQWIEELDAESEDAFEQMAGRMELAAPSSQEDEDESDPIIAQRNEELGE